MTNSGAKMSILDKELELLKQREKINYFCNNQIWSVGIELEGWLFDKKIKSLETTHLMVDEFGGNNFSKEVIKNVFEINLEPQFVSSGILTNTESQLTNHYLQCQNWASKSKANACFIGIPPHLSAKYFNESIIADLDRYHTINNHLRSFRNGSPWHIDIKNKQHFIFEAHDICLEGLTTSTQFHLKVPFDELVNIYNYAQLLSPFMVAIGANSPFIEGYQLWHESRIPLFHQSVCEYDKPDKYGCADDRVSFGHKFIANISDLFTDNLALSQIFTKNFMKIIEEIFDKE